MAVGRKVIWVLAGLLLAQVVLTRATELPPDFKRCQKNDPEVDTCLKEAIQMALRLMKNGVPSLRVLPMDPLDISKIVIEDTPNRAVSLNLVVTDSKLEGLGKVEIVNVKSDLKNMHVMVEALVPTMKINGDYVMNGKFLLLPLKGNGKLFSQIENAIVKVDIKAEPITKNGDIYWDLKQFKLMLGDVTNFINKYDNLFNGDETLAKPTLNALNTNWKEYWEALRPALEETFGAVFKNIAESVFVKVPEKHLFL